MLFFRLILNFKNEDYQTTLESTAESSHFPPSLNLLGPGGIEFDVPQGPVRLSAEDLDLLPDMSSSIEGLTIFKNKLKTYKF